MRSSILPAAILLALPGLASADDLVTKGRIKVQLFAAPAFVSEVSVDAYHNQCLSLDNNLYVVSDFRRGRVGMLALIQPQNRRARAIAPRRRPRCRDGAAAGRLLELPVFRVRFASCPTSSRCGCRWKGSDPMGADKTTVITIAKPTTNAAIAKTAWSFRTA
jgi:hypothetical protein